MATTADLSTLTVVDLKEQLRAKGLKVSGKKAELVLRLWETNSQQSAGASRAVAAVQPPRRDPEPTPKTTTTAQPLPERRSTGARRPVRPRLRKNPVATEERKGRINAVFRGSKDTEPESSNGGFDSEFDSIFGDDDLDSSPSVAEIRVKKKTAHPIEVKAAPVSPDRPSRADQSQRMPPKESNSSAEGGFADMGLPVTVVNRLDWMGLTVPTPIQAKAIPIALHQGRDVLGIAQTGTGKTVAFGVPLVANLITADRPKGSGVSALILAPTRELANQIAVQMEALTKDTPLNTLVVVGGKSLSTQTNKLKRGVDILVATPGRLMDLMDRGALSLKDASFLVLDEADMMLDMGFAPSLRKIVPRLRKDRQTMLFSATMSKSMSEIAGPTSRNPYEWKFPHPEPRSIGSNRRYTFSPSRTR